MLNEEKIGCKLSAIVFKRELEIGKEFSNSIYEKLIFSGSADAEGIFTERFHCNVAAVTNVQ
jgi:hypothetical protein